MKYLVRVYVAAVTAAIAVIALAADLPPLTHHDI